MSDSEEESFSFYGKPLEQYDEDSIPKRKPINLEDQIATDDHGRRRFHGAFTGGFSAGFFNTVGSLEGWKPTEFKSSRSEKAEKKSSKPEDFMDDEDRGEYGIAPQTIRATKDYSSRKRKRPVFSEGPIPGIPVLHSLIEAGNETIGYILMKNMDLKKKNVTDSSAKVYGCEMPKNFSYEIQRNVDDDTIPNIFQVYIKNPKNNTFGLGYNTLNKTTLNLTKSTQLVVRDKNRKLAISGQAFGVGAFENDDDDIYAKDDMSQYDFEITKEQKVDEKRNLSHPEFVKGGETLIVNKQFPVPTIPATFSGKHKVRKSRFEPILEKNEERKDMNALIRAKYLGEDIPSTSKDFTKEVGNNVTKDVGIKNISSQNVDANNIDDKNLKSKDSESKTPEVKIKDEFNLIFNKFVSAGNSDNDILARVEPTYSEHGTKEMRDAAKMKLFGPLTRVIVDWQPCSLLCKRFNVKEPTFDENRKGKRQKSQIFFEYEKCKDLEQSDLKGGLLKVKDGQIEMGELKIDEDENKAGDTHESRTDMIECQKDIEKDNDFRTSEKSFEDCQKNFSTNKNILDHKSIVDQTKIDTDKSKICFNKCKNDSNRNIFNQNKNDLQDVVASSSKSITEDVINDLPKQPDETEKINVSRNQELFKAIFLSSSESESEDDHAENHEKDSREEILKQSVLKEDLITKIKPRKEGILSNIDFSSKSDESKAEGSKEESKITESEVHESEERVNDGINDGRYGPALPTSIKKASTYTVTNSVMDDEWVEKDLIEKIDKHKKKHKKDKKEKKHKRKKSKRR